MSASNYNDLIKHFGHDIHCVTYGDIDSENHDAGFAKMTKPQNVAIECETCNEVLLDFDNKE